MAVDDNNNNNNNNNKENIIGINSIGPKAKSCKGCLYFSTLHNSKSHSPSCYGLSKTIPNASSQLLGEMELEASRTDRNLKDFKYACIGYSVYLANKDKTSDKQIKPAEMPLCVGLEVLLDRSDKCRLGDKCPHHAHSHKAEDTHAVPRDTQAVPRDTHALPQPRMHKPTNSGEDVFYSRFKRNAGLVASGVAKNINMVATCVKETLDDILFPDRRPPK